ncbi:hypothetical protein RvY_18486-2 [Ramazzottius varieornatus]|uniref:PIPK domain-containing protein n=1 Tax=Ramazzottius varieornatus TaxID=947166 RepID=A0A1D1WAI7_RAMVA|nr:hypothetical protein RvY_18486-2 [Ramazzottius varieornatus]
MFFVPVGLVRIQSGIYEEVDAKMSVVRRSKRFSTGTKPDNEDTTDGGMQGTSLKEKKIGHRRVDETGNVTYKRFRANDLMFCIQTGIRHSVSKLASKPERDLLMKDFTVVEKVFHKKDGSAFTPAHGMNDFTFKSYAPIAFRYFRELFGIAPDDYMLSLCDRAMIEISNPGASGSIFYLTEDDEFILKTVMYREAEFLQKLLPGYYMNLNQNPRTLLPKFFGQYCYQSLGKNVRIICMNNLLPRKVKYHQKFDLKGSTYKRQASAAERQKQVPTLKDLDFMQLYPEGIFLEPETYDLLIRTIRRDCTVLESFKIMDYSLLIGIHNLDLQQKELERGDAERTEVARRSGSITVQQPDFGSPTDDDAIHRPGSSSPVPPSQSEIKPQSSPMGSLFKLGTKGASGDGSLPRNNRTRPPLLRAKTNREKFAAIVQEPTPARTQLYSKFNQESDTSQILPDGVLAWNSKGERLLLFMGIIDILQCYKLRKKMEHTVKSVVLDGDQISVCHPSFYSRRFQDFMAEKVFRKVPPGMFPAHVSPSTSLNQREDKALDPLSPESSPEISPVKQSQRRSTRQSSKNRTSTVSISSSSAIEIGRGQSHTSTSNKAFISSTAPDLILDTAGN